MSVLRSVLFHSEICIARYSGIKFLDQTHRAGAAVVAWVHTWVGLLSEGSREGQRVAAIMNLVRGAGLFRIDHKCT